VADGFGVARDLAWLPMILPLWNRLPDLADVYLRLFFLR
jgi:hypothetical protein